METHDTPQTQLTILINVYPITYFSFVGSRFVALFLNLKFGDFTHIIYGFFSGTRTTNDCHSAVIVQ